MTKGETRRVAHLDMDAFYASVELLRYPSLRGHPVVIGGRSAHRPKTAPNGEVAYSKLKSYVGRGVVTTSTYEARALGVFSGMGMMKAAKLAPDAILLPTDFDAYRHYSRAFKSAVASITPKIEDRGIDEIYIDLTDEPGEAFDIAHRIKNSVVAATALSCSICVAPNKLLAKIGSDLEKPNGLTILTRDDIPSRIWPLMVSKVNGIGPKAAHKLQGLGFQTIGDVARADPAMLQEQFGRTYSVWLLRAAHGIDDRDIVTHSEPKSMSRETTFEQDLHAKLDREPLGIVFTDLCNRVAADLVRKRYVGSTVGIKLRFHDFQTVTRDVTLVSPTDDPAKIRRAASECLKRVRLDKRLRLLGVKVTGLTTKDESAEHEPMQGDLFASV